MRILMVVMVLVMGACAAGEPVSYRLASVNGRTVIQASTGEVVPWACYGLSSDVSVEAWFAKQPALIKAGVHLYQLNLQDLNRQWPSNPLLVGGPELDATRLSWAEQTQKLIEADPKARFIMRFAVTPNREWREAHRDSYHEFTREIKGYGKDQRTLLPSYADREATRLAGVAVHRAVAWCEAQQWRDRVVGYSVFNYGEGATEVALFNEYFDRSEVAQREFRLHVQEMYVTDEALQEAWGMPEVTRSTVRVPTKAEWLAKKRALGILHWPEPRQVQRERDYFTWYRGLWHGYWNEVWDALEAATAHRQVLTGGDTLKSHMMGWQHNADFRAEWEPGTMWDHNNIMLASGHVGTGPMLDHPGLDMLQTPGMYVARGVGHAWEAEGLSDSLTLRGKVNFMEADMRTWVNRYPDGKPRKAGELIKDAGVFMNEAEMRAGFDRTLAWALTRNQMYYWMSVSAANWWYHEKPVEQHVANEVKLIESFQKVGWKDTYDAICVVIDDESAMYEDFSSGFQNLAVERSIMEGVALSGVPYRVHLLSDLERDDFPMYRCWYFPNLYKIDERVEAMLRKHVLLDGQVAIFGPGTGITDGERLTAEPASRLFGVEMELVEKSTSRRVLVQDHGHPITKRLGAMTYGDSHAYGPLLVPKVQRFAVNGELMALGSGFYWYFFDRPGLFVRDVGQGGRGDAPGTMRGESDYAVVFTPTVPVPPEIFRECARYAGCHVWSEENLVIYASGNILGVHGVKHGKVTVKLPGRKYVVDVLGKRRHHNATQITIDAEGPFTKIYRLAP